MKYLIVIQKTETGYSGFSPDLEGCGATGDSRKVVEQAMRKAIRFHLDGLKEEGFPIPKPHTYSKYVEI